MPTHEYEIPCVLPTKRTRPVLRAVTKRLNSELAPFHFKQRVHRESIVASLTLTTSRALDREERAAVRESIQKKLADYMPLIAKPLRSKRANLPQGAKTGVPRNTKRQVCTPDPGSGEHKSEE